MSLKSVMPSNCLILCHPLLLLPSIFPSIRVFSNESALCIRWPKYWSFSFSISPSNEYSGLISFRIDWFYLLVVQGTLKNLVQCHSSKASILQCSAFVIYKEYKCKYIKNIHVNSIVALQYCVCAIQQSESAIYLHISPLFWISFQFRSPQSTE